MTYAAWWRHEYDLRVSWVAELDGLVGMLNMCEYPHARPGRPHSEWGISPTSSPSPGIATRASGRNCRADCLRFARQQRSVLVVLSPSERSVPLCRRAGFRSVDDDLVLLTLF